MMALARLSFPLLTEFGNASSSTQGRPGAKTSGAEGLSGLAKAFFHAGARMLARDT